MLSRNHNTLLYIFVNIYLISVCYGARLCRPLSALPGTIVQCEIPSENRIVDCMGETAQLPRGTVAKYKCARDSEFSENLVKCRCRGKWGGLRIFNDFMSNCNISDYSLNGPSELNLTQREIRLLSFPEMQMESPDVKDFQEDALAYHNFYRKIHHSPPLRLNKTLTDAAQKWADEIGDKELKTQDWTNRWYSQNLYRITGHGIDEREAVRLAVAAWYQGAYRHNWESFSGPSAFTQVVWKSTTDVGFGVKKNDKNQTVVVADYWPPGNVVVSGGDDRYAWFRTNVFPPNEISNETAAQPTASSATTTATVLTTTTTTTEAPTSLS